MDGVGWIIIAIIISCGFNTMVEHLGSMFTTVIICVGLVCATICTIIEYATRRRCCCNQTDDDDDDEIEDEDDEDDTDE